MYRFDNQQTWQGQPPFWLFDSQKSLSHGGALAVVSLAAQV